MKKSTVLHKLTGSRHRLPNYLDQYHKPSQLVNLENLRYYLIDDYPTTMKLKNIFILNHNHRNIFICDRNQKGEEKIVGRWSYHLESGQLVFVSITSDYCNQGIGTRVLNHILNDLQSHGTKYCWGVTLVTKEDDGSPSTRPIFRNSPYHLAKKFGALYCNPASPEITSVGGDGFSIEVVGEKIYPEIKDITKLNDVREVPEMLWRYLGPTSHFEKDVLQQKLPEIINNPE